jgi:hypothetical protein
VEASLVIRISHRPGLPVDTPAELSGMVGRELSAKVLGVVVVDQRKRLPYGEGVEPLKDL